MIGKPYFIRLPGNTSCSQSIGIGLKFALENPKQDHQATLFVISCQNYFSIKGVRMNNEAYTSYPSEGEILLMEGTPTFILSI